MISEPFSAIKINGIELPNRFMRSATHEMAADNEGKITERALDIYGRLGRGNIGLVVTGYAYVSPHGQAMAAQFGAHSEEMVPGLRTLAGAVHAGGGRVALQIVHAGSESPFLRKKGITCLAPSFIDGHDIPHREMSGGEVEDIIRGFGAAAERAKMAGFDAVQLHCAHGYLFSQFLSPLRNKRSDMWGGSAEGRRRFHVEVVREVRRRVDTDFPVLIKYGVMDDQEGGTSLEEGIEAATDMVAAGVDAIEVSAGMGGNKGEAGKGALPYLDRAAALKRAVPVPVGVVHGIRNLETVGDILHRGEVDMVSLSRPFIREPGLINRWLEGDRSPARCISCGQCLRVLFEQEAPPDNCCWQEYRARRKA